jgi:transglutaminase-like putative cysteine protease
MKWLFFRSERARHVLTPLQVRWLGALLIAAQLPQAPHVPVWVAITGIVLVGVRIALMRRDPLRPQLPPARIPSWTLALFAIAFAVAVRYTFGYLAGRDPSIAFLYILVAIKYLETRTTRDGALLVCLACFLSMTPFFYSQSLFAALAALPVIVLVGVALDVLSTRRDEATRSFAPGVAMRRSAVMILQGLPIAVLLFVLFPRLASPLWSLPTDSAARTGLSDSMSPGDISDLSLLDTVAFRVEFQGQPPPNKDRYWRGPVFSQFNGRTWSPGMWSMVSTAAPVAGSAITYTVTLEPNFRRSLFALDLPAGTPALSADGQMTAGSLGARVTRDQQVVVRVPVSQTLQYTQQSVLRASYPLVSRAEAASSLGVGVGNPRTIALAREMREQAGSDRAFIAAVLRKFHDEEFVYTLAPPPYGADAVDGFMFEGRRGFCEHYASAFAVMLRATGIPARIVTGYQGGRMNPRGDYMIVRQSDAHAWVEAVLVGRWQRFDPTGAVAPSRIEIGVGDALARDDHLPLFARLDATWLGNLQLTWDAFNYDWRRNVIGFNRDRQQLLWREWRLDQFAAWQGVALVLMLVAAWAAMVVGWLMWKRRKQERALVLWDDLNRRLARAGLPRQPHEGPLAYASRAALRWPQFAIAVSAIGESFAELRYGEVEAKERTALVATLQRAIEVLPAAASLRATTA